MFDPVPSYERFCDDEETAEELLKSFHNSVMAWAKRYNIELLNRYSGILSVCSKLKSLVESQGRNIRGHSNKEPIEEFQNMFQLLIYMLGDQGLLFDQYGGWNATPDIDFWQNSEQAYLDLCWAMLDRHYAYIQIRKLRKDLKSCISDQRTYKKELTNWEISEDCDLSQLHRQYLPEVDYEELKQAVAILRRDPLCRQAAPLFLFSLFPNSDKKPYEQCFYSFLRNPYLHSVVVG